MNNIFLFDIDGTLSKNGIIPASAKKTLELLNENNIVMLATGRTLGQFNDELLSLPVKGAILNNGAYAVLNNKMFFESPIDLGEINKMRNDGLSLAFLSSDMFFAVDKNKVLEDFVNYFHISLPKFMPVDYLENHKVYSFGVYGYDLDSFDTSKYPFHFVRVAPLGFDVMNEGISKASAIAKLRQMYPNSRIIAFGDNYNDIEMLEASDIRIVMNQAPEDVKKLASFITKDPLDDGIEFAVNSFLKEYL